MHYRKPALLVSFSALLLTFFFVSNQSSAQVSNLFANPSLEIATNATTPQNWSSNKWGTTQATFTYPTGGANTGTRYVKTQITAAGTGDAKWYPNPVTITPGQTYTFSEYYQSSVQSFVEIQYLLTNNTYQYVRLATLPAAGAWAQYQTTFVAPANAKSVSVLHFIQAAGVLSVDDYTLTLGSTPPPPPPPPSGSNLVPNPSVETANPSNANMPQSWTTNAWGGTAATFSYLSGGAQNGSRAVRTQVTTAGSGDAKWYFNHITVTPGQSLTFSDYYQSTTGSTVTVEFLLTNNTYQYLDLGTLPASASWQQIQKTFTVPANAKSLTIYHHISALGTLLTDNYSLTLGTTTPPPPANTNLILNSSVEVEGSPNTIPANWGTQSWGTHTSVFTYVKNAGHTGTHAARVQITSYTDGDAKWVPNTIAVVPGDTYTVSDWYQATVPTYPVIAFELTDGSYYYLGLRTAPASAAWSQFTETFQVPLNAKNMTVFHVINQVGTLSIDDMSLIKITPQGFTRGIVTLDFDDGWEEDVYTVLPVLKSYGLHATFFFATTFLESTPPTGPINQSGPAAIHAMQADGHEIGGHSVTHPDLTTLSPSNLDYELTHSKQYLESVAGAGQIKNLATPYGTYNDAVITKAKTLYSSLRTTDEGFNMRNDFDTYKLKVQNMQLTTTQAQFQSWVDQAKKDKIWLILVYHRVATSSLEEFDTPQANFGPQMQYLKNSGVTVLTTEQALQEILPQL